MAEDPNCDTTAPERELVRCANCRSEFDEELARRSCGGCSLSGCEKVRCPRCGYETVPEVKWLGAVRRWFTGGESRRGRE